MMAKFTAALTMTLTVALAAMVLAAGLVACSRSPVPPQGQWEGVYETPDIIIAARLQIGRNGAVRISAPDATNIATASAPERQNLRERLAAELSAGWSHVEPRQLDFDGHVFRKPGGIAPQMVWDAHAKQMTLVLYLGTRPSIKIPVRAVAVFSEDPFSS